MDRDRGSRPIDEQLLAGLVLLAQHHILLAAPALVQLAEAAVAIAVRVCLPVLLPEQLLRQVWMLLSLLVKVGEVRHRQHRRASPWRPTEQRSLQPVFVPLLPKRPRDSGSFGPLQILVYGAEANRATAGDLPQPQAHCKLQSKNFFDLTHGQSPGWQADPPFLREATCHCVVQRRSACGNHSGSSRTRFRDRPETVRLHRGIGVHLHPGILFGFTPEQRSESSRNRVHVPPDSPVGAAR